MALAYKAGNLITGLSTDSKPTTNLPTGYRFYETDTFSHYIWNATTWDLVSNKSFIPKPSNKKWTTFQGGTAGVSADGFMGGVYTNVPSSPSRTLSTTNGTASTWATTTADNNPAGILPSTVTLLARALNPILRVKFAVSVLATTRVFIGFQNVGTSPTGEDPYNGNTKSAFIFGKRNADTNWQIMTQNSTAQATQFTDTLVGIGSDAAVHTVELVGVDGSSGFTWSLDGSAPSLVTASVPATGTGIAPIIHIENVSGGAAKTLSVYYAECISDK